MDTLLVYGLMTPLLAGMGYAIAMWRIRLERTGQAMTEQSEIEVARYELEQDRRAADEEWEKIDTAARLHFEVFADRRVERLSQRLQCERSVVEANSFRPRARKDVESMERGVTSPEDVESEECGMASP